MKAACLDASNSLDPGSGFLFFSRRINAACAANFFSWGGDFLALGPPRPWPLEFPPPLNLLSFLGLVEDGWLVASVSLCPGPASLNCKKNVFPYNYHLYIHQIKWNYYANSAFTLVSAFFLFKNFLNASIFWVVQLFTEQMYLNSRWMFFGKL